MFLVKLLLFAATTVVSPEAVTPEARPEVVTNPDGTVSISYTLPKGSTEGVYIADKTSVMVVKPSAVLAELGLDVNDRILSSCGKDLTTSALSDREKLEAVKLKQTEDCVLKVSRKNAVIYFSFKKK